jgi:hypothetical protein
LLLLIAVALASCSRAIPVENAQQAIAIGVSKCDRDWGQLYKPYGVDFRSFNWHAEFFNGDRWSVSVTGANKSKLEVIVPKSGGAPSACAMYGKFAK